MITLISEYFSLTSTRILACSDFAGVLGPPAAVAMEVTSPAGTCPMAQGALPSEGAERFLCGQAPLRVLPAPGALSVCPCSGGQRAHPSQTSCEETSGQQVPQA